MSAATGGAILVFLAGYGVISIVINAVELVALIISKAQKVR